MPINLNSVGASGIGGGSEPRGFSEYTKYTGKMNPVLGGFDFNTLSTTSSFSQGSSVARYTDFKNKLYVDFLNDSSHKMYDVNVQFSNGNIRGSFTLTEVATIGNDYILDRESIGEYMYIIADSKSDVDKHAYARLYRYDGTSITDVFGTDILDLTDIYGNKSSSNWDVANATSQLYRICPIVKTDGSKTDEMIIAGNYHHGSATINPTYTYWYYIESLSTKPKVKYVIMAGSPSPTFPSGRSIFTESGNIASTTTRLQREGSYGYEYTHGVFITGKYVINDDGDNNLSATITIDKSTDLGKRAFPSLINLAEPLNNNYLLVTAIEGGQENSQIIFHICVDGGELVVTPLFVNIYELSSVGTVWSDVKIWVSFKYRTPCFIISYTYDSNNNSSTRFGKINSPWSVTANAGTYTLTGFFSKGDTIYSDDGIYKYTCKDEEITLDEDVRTFVIPISGLYTIYTRCSDAQPLDCPPVTVKTVHGSLEHLEITAKSNTTIQANLTSNISVNNATPIYGIHTYESDDGKFLFSLK